MRIRLFVVLVTLMTIGLGALGVPLAESQARTRTQQVFLDRLNDTSRFASIAEQSDAVGESLMLEAELSRYDEAYGIAAAVLARDGRVQFATRPWLRLDGVGAEVHSRVSAALGGRHSSVPHPAWPWAHDQLVVAEPMINRGAVVGAVVTISPFGETRSQVLHTWARLGMVELAALAACVLTALALTRWMLRPVRLVDHVAKEIAAGRRGARVPSGNGPPELRRLAHSLNDLADHVEAVLEAQTAFVADASHQLRNPLNALMLRLDDLAMRVPPEWEAEMSLANDEGRHLSEILDGLLRLADAERRGTAPERVDVVRVVTERVDAWRTAARLRGMTLRQLGAGPMLGHVDPLALSTAVDSVVDNALKFGPAESAVTIEVVSEPGQVAIVVTDEGQGLTPAELTRAGDRFWRSRRHQNVEGSGLGLAVARTLLAPSAGRLEVAAAPGGGLQVTIRCCTA